MELKQISLRGLRCFREKQCFPLSPLSFAVGANSTGKSTFLRVFPLLRQSTETTTKGPILWYGDYVDFGVFDEAVSRGIEPKEIDFEFTISLEQTKRRRDALLRRQPIHILEEDTIKVVLSVSANRGNSFTRRLSISLFDCEILIISGENGVIEELTIDGEVILLGAVRAELRAGSDFFSLIPLRKQKFQTSEGKSVDYWARFPGGLIGSQVLNRVKDLYHGHTSPDKQREVADSLGLGRVGSFLLDLQKLASNTPSSEVRAKYHTVKGVSPR